MPLPTFRTAIFAIAFGMAAPLPAQQAAATAEGEAGRKPLNLSLPREAVFTPGTITRQDPTLRDNLRAPPRQEDADQAPPDRTAGERDGTAHAPYGTGFEARRRGLGGRGFGGGSGGPGGGTFGGGGRGMGRGR